MSDKIIRDKDTGELLILAPNNGGDISDTMDICEELNKIKLEQQELKITELRTELGWRTLERDQALARLKYAMRRCTCGKCVDAPSD